MMPALDLVQPEHAAKLGRLSRFAFANNRRVGLKQTDDLLAGRHLFALQDPPRRLRDDLLDQREELGQRPRDPLGRGGGLGGHHLLHMLGPGHDRGGHVKQVPIGGFEPLGGRLAPLPRDLHNPLHLVPGLLGEVRRGLLGDDGAIPQQRAWPSPAPD